MVFSLTPRRAASSTSDSRSASLIRSSERSGSPWATASAIPRRLIPLRPTAPSPPSSAAIALGAMSTSPVNCPDYVGQLSGSQARSPLTTGGAALLRLGRRLLPADDAALLAERPQVDLAVEVEVELLALDVAGVVVVHPHVLVGVEVEVELLAHLHVDLRPLLDHRREELPDVGAAVLVG